MLSKVYQRFVDQAPVCVMVRLAMERALGDEAVDQLFRETADRQYQKQLLFSTVLKLMMAVVCGSRRSIHQAYRQASEPVSVSLASVYNKLDHLEPRVSAALVHHSAQALSPLIQFMRPERPGPLSGYPVRIVDGNHFAATEHRLAELRGTHLAALPAQALAVLDPQTRLITDLIPAENAHSQERLLIPALLERVAAGQLWIADRNFCTTAMLKGVAKAGAYFLIRQHQSTLHWRELEEFRCCGRIETGRVWQQSIEIRDPLDGWRMTIRRVKLELDEPTEDGESELFLLSNLPEQGPAAVSAKQIAAGYKGRWGIEQAFEELTLSLRGEIATLGYPQAAIFGFATAAVAYNLVSLVMASLALAHGEEKVQSEVSGYHLAREWEAMYEGMVIAVQPRQWTQAAQRTDREFVDLLEELAAAADLRRYRKAKRGPKKKPLPWSGSKRTKHLATAKLLQQRKAPAKAVNVTP